MTAAMSFGSSRARTAKIGTLFLAMTLAHLARFAVITGSFDGIRSPSLSALRMTTWASRAMAVSYCRSDSSTAAAMVRTLEALRKSFPSKRRLYRVRSN